MKKRTLILLSIVLVFMMSCNENMKDKKPSEQKIKKVTAKDILGNSDYLAISYGGYREKTRNVQPTIVELKDDLKILSAMGIKIIRTYNVQLSLPHASNILKAITELKSEDPNYEMYVMLGAWIDCLNAWTDQPMNHNIESPNNAAEIDRAVALANQYPDIVKVLAVGNEAMVKWATSYFVQPKVILKWVKYLQNLKKENKLPKDLWVTSSDNFASWGGGGDEYHVEDLNKLIQAVDFLSVHTYPMHDTHYRPEFWLNTEGLEGKTDMEKIEISMLRAKKYAMMQYENVKKYMESLGVYKYMIDWTNEAGISCFYFEGFDEPWKGGDNSGDSEKHFGLFTVDGKAKYALWDMVDQGIFEGLTRNGNVITKTYDGSKKTLMESVLVPPSEYETMAN